MHHHAIAPHIFLQDALSSPAMSSNQSAAECDRSNHESTHIQLTNMFSSCTSLDASCSLYMDAIDSLCPVDPDMSSKSMAPGRFLAFYVCNKDVIVWMGWSVLLLRRIMYYEGLILGLNFNRHQCSLLCLCVDLKIIKWYDLWIGLHGAWYAWELKLNGVLHQCIIRARHTPDQDVVESSSLWCEFFLFKINEIYRCILPQFLHWTQCFIHILVSI